MTDQRPSTAEPVAPIAVDEKEFRYSPGRARRFAEFYGDNPREAWIHFVATWFGSGLAPVLPGTFGTLFALPPAWLLHHLIGGPGLFFAAIALFVVGIPICRTYVKINEAADPGEVVIDEAAAVWLLLSLLPPTGLSYLVAFVVFRLFDIFKPWPVSFFDRRVKGGFGIMLDDMIAAIYPLTLVWIADLFMPGLLVRTWQFLAQGAWG